ncbi:MAG: B12-binding domain-containing radical SAM protein [Promethearchaeota archaeon]
MSEIRSRLLSIIPSFFFIDEYHKDLYYHKIPYNTLQLTSFLRKELHIESDFLDLRFEEELEAVLSSNKFKKEMFQKKLLKVLEEKSLQNFQNVIIILNSSYEYLQTKMIAETIKKEFSKLNIIVGGHHPTVIPKDFLYQNSPFDYIIEGELELSVLKLFELKTLKKSNNANLPHIINLGKLVDLNILPFPDYKVYLKKYSFKNYFNFEICMSKGCPFNCNFCRIMKFKEKSNSKKNIIRNYSFPKFLNNFRKLQKVVQEYWTKEPKVGFSDQIFNIAQISKKILNHIINNHLQETFKFACQTRIEFIDHFSDIIDLIRKSKMIVGYGFETANKKLLIEMNKTKDPSNYIKKMENIIKIYKKFKDPYFRINIIAGFPGEDQNSFQDTIDFLNLNADCEYIQINPTLFINDPITNVYNNMDYYQKEYGTEFSREWWKIPSDPLLNSILPKPSNHYSKKQLIGDYKTNYIKLLTKFKYNQFKANINWKVYFNKCYKKLS